MFIVCAFVDYTWDCTVMCGGFLDKPLASLEKKIFFPGRVIIIQQYHSWVGIRGKEEEEEEEQ